MSKRAFVTVQKSFAAETASAFGFLASELGLAGPEVRTEVLPVITFVGLGLRYKVMLDSCDHAVTTRVEIDLDVKRLVAELDDLVPAAGLGTRIAFSHSAFTLYSLRRWLESQAGFVRLLHPYMTSENVVDLMRAANAREWSVR